MNDSQKMGLQREGNPMFELSTLALALIRGDDGRILNVNRAFEELSGWEKSECLGMTTLQLGLYNRGDDREDIWSDIRAGKPVLNREFEGKTKAGIPLFGLMTLNFLPSESGPLLLATIANITAEKKARLEKEKSEAWFQAVFDQSSDAIAIVKEGSVVNANAAYKRLFGLPPSENPSINPVARVFLPESRPVIDKLLLGLEKENADPSRAEFRGLRTDGGTFDLELRASAIRHGDETLSLLIFRDVTSENQKRDELREVRRLLQAAMEQNPAGIIIADAPEGRLRLINRTAERILGQTREEYAGPFLPGKSRSRWLAFHPDGSAWPLDDLPLSRAIRDGAVTAGEEILILRPDGEECWILANATPITGENGEPVAGITVFVDITGEKRMRDHLEISEQRFRSFVEHSTDGIAIVDELGTILEWNRGQEKITGIPARESVGKPVWEVQFRMAPSALRTEEHREHIRGLSVMMLNGEEAQFLGSPSVREIETPVGERRFIQATVFRIVAGSQIHLGTVSRDVTHQAQMEQGLRDENRELEERVKAAIADMREKDRLLLTQSRLAAMGELIGHIAHQWRQPLNALGITVQNVLYATKAGRADQDYIDRAVNKSMDIIQFMSDTIDDFRRFFKRDDTRTDFDAAENIRRTCGLVSDTFRHEGIELILELAAGVTINGFPNEFSQVILNLLANSAYALRVRKPSAPEVRISIAKMAGGRSCLTVADNAGGIPAEIIDRIFDPYFTTKESGTGIGLYMCRTIVERNMGGRITAANDGKGAVLTVEI